MKITRIQVLACFIVLCSLLVSFSPPALAAPNLQWQTDRVYYDNHGLLTIEGYFYNAGTSTITWVHWQKMSVYFRKAYTSWWLQAASMFHNINITLTPGDKIHWTFRIANVNYTEFDQWDVQWVVNYDSV